MTERLQSTEQWAKETVPAIFLALGLAACGNASGTTPIVSPGEVNKDGYNTRLLLNCHQNPAAQTVLPEVAIAKLTEPEAYMVGPTSSASGDSSHWLAVKVFNAVGSDIVLQPNDERYWPLPLPDKVSIDALQSHKAQIIQWPQGNYRITVRMKGPDSAPRLTLGAMCGAALK